jgi:hypothetical protein
MSQRRRRQIRRWIERNDLLNKRFFKSLDHVDKRRKMGRNMLRPDVWTYRPFTGSGLIHKGRKP